MTYSAIIPLPSNNIVFDWLDIFIIYINFKNINYKTLNEKIKNKLKYINIRSKNKSSSPEEIKNINVTIIKDENDTNIQDKLKESSELDENEFWD
jgi:hypothetical protein